MNPESRSRRLTRNLAIVTTGFALWGALVLLFAAPLALPGRISWRQAINFGVSFWALWLFFLPTVAWLSFRFPIERRRLFRNVGIHLAACLLVVVATRVSFRIMDRLSAAVQRAERSGRAPDVRPSRLGAPGALGAFHALRAALDILVYWSLVGLCQAITNFRSSEERERRAAELEARFTSAKLQALRMQINPHFLFNTLNSIAALIYVNPRAADEMLGDLSELLRRSLSSMEEQEISLAQELEIIGGYMRIEQKRFGERLRMEQRVPDELMKAVVPALILQPLVENAIRHGIEPQREPGVISIEARRDNHDLHLTVRDNGRGLGGAEVNGSTRRGIGLANTQARLQGLYGQHQSFTVGRAEPKGCRVDIRLPFHLQSLQAGPETHPHVSSLPGKSPA
ncbi:MAG: sensor histidine kinase [Verrucomicrobiota bacterium]